MARARLVGLLMAVGLAASAHANAAMGLALEMFVPWTWALYVVAMIALEAYWIGVRAGIPVGRAIQVSTVANLATAIAGVACCCQVFAPFLHTAFVGESMQPRPLPNAVVLLVALGAITSIVEAAIWDRLTGIRGVHCRPSFVAHMMGVPIALSFLLIPARPYRGLEATCGATRVTRVRRLIPEAIRSDRDALETPDRLIATMRSIDPEIDVALRPAEFGRFDCVGLGGPAEPIFVNPKRDGDWLVRWGDWSLNPDLTWRRIR